MKYLLLSVLVVSLVGIMIPAAFANHAEWESSIWQKGEYTFANSGDDNTGMTLTLPNGKINSQSILLNYVYLRTDQSDESELRNGGGFIQVGIVYPNSQKTNTSYDDMDFFYSDGIAPFPIDHPYNVGAKYTFQIFYDTDFWWIHVTDDVSGKKTTIKADWASGNNITDAGIVLESLSLVQQYQPDKLSTLSQIKDVGTLSNILDQRFFIGSKNDNFWVTDTFQGWTLHEQDESEALVVDVHILMRHIVPPQFVLFENNNGFYEVGFEKTQVESIPNSYNEYTSDNKIPDWVRNIFIWYGEEQISEDELLNAIKFLVNQGIINLNE